MTDGELLLKAGIDDVQARNNFFAWLSEYRMEEKYLTDLANKTVLNKSKHFIIVRSIVLDAHLRLDYHISSVVGFMLIFRGTHHGVKYDGQETKQFIDLIHERIDYTRRVDMIEKLKLFSRNSIRIMREVNNIRVAFAHGKDSAKHNYFNECIFEKATIDKLQADMNIVIAEYLKFIECCTSK